MSIPVVPLMKSRMIVFCVSEYDEISNSFPSSSIIILSSSVLIDGCSALISLMIKQKLFIKTLLITFLA